MVATPIVEAVMKINKMTQSQLLEFYHAMGLSFGVQFVNISCEKGKEILSSINNLLSTFVNIEFELRPMCFGPVIALPFEPGTPDRSQLNQIEIVVHEVHHKTRMKNYREWMLNYFRGSDFRALEEVSARLAESEVYYWYTGHFCKLQLDPAGYLLDVEDMRMAEKSYQSHIADLSRKPRGTCYFESSRRAIEILDGLGVVPV
jgi:hypothetical protein